MTICIAGISESKKIVAFTDKMLTINGPVKTAFEINENDKAIKLGDKVVAMFAGDVLKANLILKNSKINIGVNTNMGVEKVAEIIEKAYRDQWVKDIEDTLLQRFGLDRKKFLDRQKDLEPELVKSINNLIADYNLGVEIIVTGITKEEPHIFQIANPGKSNCYDSIGYCCIGSGTQHATFSLIETHYNPSLNEEQSIHILLQAKKRAEFDPGVGKLTDIVLINDNYINLNEDKIKSINDIHDASISVILEEKRKCADKIKKLIYD